MSLVAVFIASLLGSPHCAGMCGGFVAFYSGSNPKSFSPHIAYNGGRLLTYMSLGSIAAYVGKAVDISGSLVGISRLMAIVTGALLIFWGARMLVRGSAIPSSPHTKGLLHRILRPVYGRILSPDSHMSATKRAFFLGLLSTCLPCGWLYSFVAVAAASADPLQGAAIMAFFWVGTLPALASLAAITQIASSSLRGYIPRITAVLLVFAGFVSIGIHAGLLPHSHDHHAHTMHADSVGGDHSAHHHESSAVGPK